ncbi:hypothetical protein HGRIS_002675 [Hohenbuehelia grisea]|uniref:Uncharacterized protein n=1 Tax=Hohenbuehelia grisea TaxID=104357 RepID=A0ABR3JL76_9AGAR
MLVAGILSLLIWFEVASTPDMTTGERAAFVIAGLVETSLFVASILGFSGVIVRKQRFVQIYAYFMYFHFFLNVGIAAWLLWVVTHGTENAAVKACQQTVKDAGAQNQCIGLLKIAKAAYLAIAAIVLLTEMYGAIIVARYVNQIQREKRTLRASRMASTESAFKLMPNEARYSSLPGGQRSLHTPQPSFAGTGASIPASKEFDPYEEVGSSAIDYNSTAGPSYSYGIPPPITENEVAYGGGGWTHSEIEVEEKQRLRQQDMVINAVDEESRRAVEEEIDEQIRDSKASEALSSKCRSSTDDLPRYTLTDSTAPRIPPPQ